jgi:hypothetical protein
MARQTERVQVSLAPDGFSSQSFRWQARVVRVLAVESVRRGGMGGDHADWFALVR